MAVWLTHGSRTVGFDDGVIRARDHAQLVEAGQVLELAVAERDRMLALARSQADALLESAREEAASLVAEAQASFEGAYTSGLERGLHDAAAQWAGQALDVADANRRSLHRQSERLSTLVSMAVERVIDQEDRAGLFRRSLRTIMKLVKDVPLLTMRVPESDVEHARRALEAMQPQLGAAMTIEVVGDRGLQPGACRFESDQGVVDASLDTQLAALRRAVDRAAGQMVLEDTAPAPEDEGETEIGDDARLHESQCE